MREKSPGQRYKQPSSLWIAALVLFAGAIGYGTYGLLADDAIASTTAPRITLDTLQGQYVVGDPPGRIVVLFFSFPG